MHDAADEAHAAAEECRARAAAAEAACQELQSQVLALCWTPANLSLRLSHGAPAFGSCTYNCSQND